MTAKCSIERVARATLCLRWCYATPNSSLQAAYRYCFNTTDAKQMCKMSWQAGLIKTILDPANLIISTDIAVVIADKYPKARHHYLVLPREDIASIFQLSRKHLPLLEELHLLATNIIEVRGKHLERFQIGFHAQPSMQRLHLHVISKDFVSSWLKTKKHWNSFNTPFFVLYETLYAQLKDQGCIERYSKDIVNELLARPLTCNQCDYVAKNMPTLKEHLQQNH